MAWCMPGAEKGLAEASFLLRLLMAPSGHPNRIREASPELRSALLGEAAPGVCHQLGLSQPGSLHASLAPWPGPQIALEEFVPRGRASTPWFRKALC